MKITWDNVGERFYETGVDHGVLYLPDNAGSYVTGVPWNGLTGITESPSGAEPSAQYADNMKYLNLISAEEFNATLEAFTYPDEFLPFDGLKVPTAGVTVGQQRRGSFGLSYRTLVGNDLEGQDHAYKIHLVYGCQAAPSEKANTTVNDTPEAMTLSWALSTTPVPVPIDGYKPTATITVDSRSVNAESLAQLEQVLYGDTGVNPMLPLPAYVITLFEDDATIVTPPQPAFNPATNTITIPSVGGITYFYDGEPLPSGALVISEDAIITARPNAGYVFTAGIDDDWFYNYTE